jgi:hypothetical protein
MSGLTFPAMDLPPFDGLPSPLPISDNTTRQVFWPNSLSAAIEEQKPKSHLREAIMEQEESFNNLTQNYSSGGGEDPFSPCGMKFETEAVAAKAAASFCAPGEENEDDDPSPPPPLSSSAGSPSSSPEMPQLRPEMIPEWLIEASWEGEEVAKSEPGVPGPFFGAAPVPLETLYSPSSGSYQMVPSPGVEDPTNFRRSVLAGASFLVSNYVRTVVKLSEASFKY